MLFRLLLFGLLFYMGYRIVTNLLKAPNPKSEVRGKKKTKPIDLSKHDVEDADFEDLDE
ncbi:hypothetical protein MJD09_03590 [bacterium]|nr:hypothetical protein [bacterium]